MWPFTKRADPPREQRAAFPSVTAEHLAGRRAGVLSDGAVPLSATIAACVGTWSRAFAQLDPGPDPNPLTAAHLAAIGQDLCLRGESCWHVRLEGNELALHRVAYWDMFAGGRFHLHLAKPHETETIRALAGEVILLTINSAPETPWQGRSPFRMMGASPRLMAEIEAAVSGAAEWVGRGLLPFPDVVPEEQQSAALRGLKGGGMLAAIRSRADFATSTGNPRPNEFRRVELTPDLESADLNPTTEQLHNRLLAACGIPPTLFTPNGNAGAMREGWRVLALNTVAPLARQMLPELSKCGVTSLSTKSMMAADVAGRARAVGVLVQAGVPLAEAMQLVGWGKDDGGNYE